MSPADSPELTLAQLRKSYARQLPQLLNEIEQSAQQVLAHGWDMDDTKRFKHTVHKLAGSTASFGFPLVNAQLKTLESFLNDVLNEYQPLPEQNDRLDYFLKQLRQAFADDRQEDIGEIMAHAQNNPTIRDARASHRIYLVEDDPFQAQELSAQISYFGYSVESIQDLDALRKNMEKEIPRAILMDVIFPEGLTAGPEMIRQMKQENHKNTPVIFISESNTIVSRLHAVRAGGNAYFTKPVDIGILVDMLDQLVVHEPVETCRVLLIDDNPLQAEGLIERLKTLNCEVMVITDPMQIMQPLVEHNPNMILIALDMAICNGLELAQVIRQLEQFVVTPILYLSDASKMQNDGFFTMKDTLSKDIDLESLKACLNARLNSFGHLRAMMVRDSLTGLYNHTTIKSLLDQEISRANRQVYPLTFAMLDIDHFKNVNDTYGHAAGDRVLKSLSRLLSQRLRKSDSIGRYGGEEFAIILPNTPLDAAAVLMNTLRESFSLIRHRTGEREFSITFSSGLASFPEFGNAEILIDCADKALYAAKGNGRNQVFTWTAETNATRA